MLPTPPDPMTPTTAPVQAARRRLGHLFTRLAALALAGPLGLLAAAPVAAQGQPQPVRGGLLQVGVAPEPTLLTSAFITTMNIGMVSSKVLEGLVAYDLDLNPVPALATAWTVAPDGRSVTFKLRPGVKWHDGKDFSAADVKFTLEKVWKELHPFGRAAYANVTRVDTPDPLTVVITRFPRLFHLTGSKSAKAAR